MMPAHAPTLSLLTAGVNGLERPTGRGGGGSTIIHALSGNTLATLQLFYDLNRLTPPWYPPP